MVKDGTRWRKITFVAKRDGNTRTKIAKCGPRLNIRRHVNESLSTAGCLRHRQPGYFP